MICQARVSPVLGKAPSSICKGYVYRANAQKSLRGLSLDMYRATSPSKKERIAQKHRSKDQIQTEKDILFHKLEYIRM